MRQASFSRNTLETSVRVGVGFPDGERHISTGVGFFDHLLRQLDLHGGLGLLVEASGDLETGSHHVVEDVAICLGRALDESLGDRADIERFGSAWVPMDDALVMAAVDLGGRPFLDCRLALGRAPGSIGGMEIETVEDFMRALAVNARMNVHLRTMAGRNHHHVAEAAFKALGRAVAQAAAPRACGGGPASTKGVV